MCFGCQEHTARASVPGNAKLGAANRTLSPVWRLNIGGRLIISIIIADETYFRAFCIAHSAF